jgi:hypothetical protein
MNGLEHEVVLAVAGGSAFVSSVSRVNMNWPAFASFTSNTPGVVLAAWAGERHRSPTTLYFCALQACATAAQNVRTF